MSFKKKSLEKKEPVHKIIMAGSGGVGKSSITLQYCYKEVRGGFDFGFDHYLICFSFSSPLIMNQQRRTLIERR